MRIKDVWSRALVVGLWLVVSKLWPDDLSSGVEETVRDVKICKNSRNYVVAATPEKSKTFGTAKSPVPNHAQQIKLTISITGSNWSPMRMLFADDMWPNMWPQFSSF